MKTKICILFLFFFFVNSCGDDGQSKDEDFTNQSTDKSGLSPKKIEALDYTDYVLSPEAENAVADWQKYQQLAIQINYLKQGDLSLFNGERDVILDFSKALEDSIPDAINTNPVASRVAVVITSLLKLNDDLVLDNISTEDQLKSIKQLFVAFSNLNFQINKKLERDVFDNIRPE